MINICTVGKFSIVLSTCFCMTTKRRPRKLSPEVHVPRRSASIQQDVLVGPSEVSILALTTAGHACCTSSDEMHRRNEGARVVEWERRCVERAGSQEEFARPLQATLCAPGMVVVCRNAAVLSHHRAPSSAYPFAFLIRHLVPGIIKLKQLGFSSRVVRHFESFGHELRRLNYTAIKRCSYRSCLAELHVIERGLFVSRLSGFWREHVGNFENGFARNR